MLIPSAWCWLVWVTRGNSADAIVRSDIATCHDGGLREIHVVLDCLPVFALSGLCREVRPGKAFKGIVFQLASSIGRGHDQARRRGMTAIVLAVAHLDRPPGSSREIHAINDNEHFPRPIASEFGQHALRDFPTGPINHVRSCPRRSVSGGQAAGPCAAPHRRRPEHPAPPP